MKALFVTMTDQEKIFACLLLIIMLSTCKAFYSKFMLPKYQSRSSLHTLKMQEDRQLSYNAEVVEIRQVQVIFLNFHSSFN